MEYGLHIGKQFIPYRELTGHRIPDNQPFEEALKFLKDYVNGETRFQFQTSGSTGPPKKVFLTRDQLKQSARATAKALKLQTGYRCLVSISTNHIGGKMMLVRGIETGMNLYLRKPQTIPDISDLPPIDFVALVPLQLRSLLNSPVGQSCLNHCKMVIVGGGQVDTELSEKTASIGAAIYQTYGMTETASHIALMKLNPPGKQNSYQALPGIKVEADSIGRLTINGAVTNHQPLITNDLVQIIDKNSFKWIGRFDEAINTGGYKVIPQNLYPAVADCLEYLRIQTEFVIVGLPDEHWGESVVLVLERILAAGQEQQIIRCLKQKLVAYQVPKKVLFLTTFPKTPTHKPDIPKIKKMLSTGG